MESRVDDLKLAGAPSAVVGEAGTLAEHQLVMALPFSESFCETPAQVVEQVAPVVGQGTDKRRKRRRQTKSLAPKHHPAPKTMKEEEEEVCFICFDGGSLVLCDRKGCPKAYHPACIKREEAFFQSKAKWDCGWHICSICEKAAHYMCYTCTYALCKRCSKNADYVCVRENKGFCTMCMKTIMMIENIDAGNKELIQVDFDDKTSWEYLFKMYWNLLKGKLSLSVDELIQAKNPLVGVIGTDLKQQTPGKDKSTGGVAVRILPKSSEHSKQNPRRGVIGTDIKQQIPEKDNFTEGVAVPNLLKSSEHSEQNTLQDQHQLPDQSSFSAEKLRADKRKISDVCTDWGSKELLEFVAHMKNGDTSVLSQADVQALLMAYIKKNNLLNPRMKSQVICDLRLKLLFGKPRVGHIEMLKLLECHYLLKEDTPKNAFIDGCTSHVGDDQNDDSVSNPGKRQKTRKKGEERAPKVNLNEYAAIDAHNINLIFLRRTAIENLIDEVEKFHEKVVGSVVRIRVSCNDQGQDFYRLVRVVGTSKGSEPYKLGYKTTDFMIEVLNLDKKETLSIDAVSNQVFTEDECKDLHQNVKCGIVKPLTVGDIQMKAVALQPLRFDDWLIAEILRLSHLRDKADENGHKKEHRECVEKLKLLRTPEVRHQKLTEIPEVHIDPKMNPNHQSEDDTSKDDKQKGEVSKLGITGDHTLQPRKCVKENEATSAQAVQQKRDDGDGSNSSPNHRLRPRKSVKENKTSSAQRVQPKRGRGGSNGFPKQENHVSPGGSSSVVGNQSVLRPDSETVTVAPVSTIRAQKRDGGGSSSFPKQETDVSPGGSSSLVGNQSVPRPDSETAAVAPVSSIQVQQKRDGGGSNSFPKQENHVSPGGDGSTNVIGNQSVLRPDSETATVAPVSTIRVQPKRHGVTSNSISKQENRVSPGGSSSVLGNQSVRRSDSETATVAPVSTIRVQPKRDGGRSNSIPKQENHVSPGVFSSVPGNQSVPRPDPETVSVAPVSTIRVQQKRGSGRSKSFPKQENQVSAGCSSSVAGNQSVLRPDQVTAKVAPVSRIRVQQKKGGGGSKSSPKHENHVSPRGSSSVVSNQSVQMPDLETATVAPVSRIQVQQKRDRGDSNSSPKQENHVSLSDSSIVIGNQSELKPDSETATVSPVSGIQAQQKGAGDGSNSSPQQDNHVSLGGGSSSVIGNQSVLKPDSEIAAVAPVSGIQVQEKRDGGSDSSPQQHNHVSPGGGSSSVIGNQSVLRSDSEAATVAPVSGTYLPTNDTQMEKLWHYRDPNGKIQGPFSIVQLQKWSTTGYFPLDMRIWTDNEQDHSVLLTDALAGDLCSDTRSNAAGEGLDSDTSDCSAQALAKEKQPEVVQCCDLLKTVAAYSERPVVRNNNLETYAEPLNQVTKPGVEELNDAGVNEHPDEAPLHDSSGMVSEVAGVNEHPNEALMHHSPSIESKNAGVNVHPVEAPLQYAPSIESKDAGINDHPDETLLHCSPAIDSKDAGVNEHPNEAQLHRSPDIERKDAGVNKHPTEAPMHHSPSIESENACVNEHPNEASLLHSPGIESKEMSSMNQNCVSSGQIRPPVLLDLDLNNKDCNPASSLSNPNESPESKVDSDLVILPSPTPKTGDRNSESQLNEEDSMSIDIQAAELLRSLSGYVPVNGMTVSDVQTPANNEMDEDLPIPTPKPSDSDDGDLRNPEQKPSDENQFGQSDENRLEESDDGPCKILMKDLGWSNASSQVVGGVATAGVWISSPARDEPSCKEWDFGLVPMSSLQHSDAVGGDQVATTTPNGSRHLLLDLSSWPAGINEPIEFNTLAEESVSDLLAEVDAMESKSGLPSPSSAMRCGDDLIDRNDCFSSIEELSPTPDAGKSDAVSSNPGIRFPSQATEFHDHDPVGASQVSAFDPLKRSTAHSTTSSGAETKSVGYPINFWEPGPDIHPPAPGTLNQQPMVNAPPPNHVWGAVQGNVNMGWAGPPPLPPPPQAFANMGWRPSIGTTAPWVDSNLSLGAYNGNGGWDNNPHRFSGSRDYAVQSGDMGFGRGGRTTWNRQQHGGGGGGGGGGHSRPSPKGQRVCKFYESGHCKKGSACGYLHP